MFALASFITALVLGLVGGISEAIGFRALKRICVYGFTISFGFAVAGGIGALLGVVWPDAGDVVALVLCLCWAWIGWRYAGMRDRRAASKAAVHALQQWSEASKASAEAEAEACYALVDQVSKRVGGAAIGYDGAGRVFIHPELARTSQTIEAHRGTDSEKIVVQQRFTLVQGAPRCRQSVARTCLDLHL